MYNHFILLSACAGSLTEVKSGDDRQREKGVPRRILGIPHN
jgi:hypothetical protein